MSEAEKFEAPRPNGKLSERIAKVLLDRLLVEGASEYESERLHYGADLDPGTCERKIWYRLHGTKHDPEDLGSQIRFWGGRNVEQLVVDALRGAGLTVKTQVQVRPLRKSAWCWSPGRADVVIVDWKHMIEVKAPRAGLFQRARSDPTLLAKESYRFQASAYFHELRSRKIAATASFLFLDREGANQPVELPLEGDLLIPLEQIVAEEDRKAYLFSVKEPPPRIAAGKIQVGCLKGGRETRTFKPERKLEATISLNWQCGYCSFRETCQPGPEERVVDLTAAQHAYVLGEAEARWTAGEKNVTVTLENLPPPPKILTEAALEQRLKRQKNTEKKSSPAPMSPPLSPPAAPASSPMLGKPAAPASSPTTGKPAAPASSPTSPAIGKPAAPTSSPSPTTEKPAEKPAEKSPHTFEKREDSLASCTVCGGGEGTLPTECPRELMSAATQEAVYTGAKDYERGRWVEIMIGKTVLGRTVPLEDADKKPMTLGATEDGAW